MVKIDERVLQDVRKQLHGTSTVEGIEMLSLNAKNLPQEYWQINTAGNTYLAALRTIQVLMQALGMDDQLYTKDE